MHELGFQNMVADGGNSLTLDGEFMGIKPLDTQACIDVIEECERLGVVWAISFDDSRRRWIDMPQLPMHFVHDSYMETVVDPELDYRSIECFYKVYVICSPEEEGRIASLSKVPTARSVSAHMPYSLSPLIRARESSAAWRT